MRLVIAFVCRKQCAMLLPILTQLNAIDQDSFLAQFAAEIWLQRLVGVLSLGKIFTFFDDKCMFYSNFNKQSN